MARLKISITQADPGLIVSGGVFDEAAVDNTPPLWGPSTVRPMFPKRFELSYGVYVFRFHVEGTGGKFTLAIADGSDNVIVSRDFNTEDAFYGLILRFAVIS